MKVTSYVEPTYKKGTRGLVHTSDKESVLKQNQKTSQFLSQTEDKIKELFQKYDSDKSGFVSIKELKEGLQEAGVILSNYHWDLLKEVHPEIEKANFNDFKKIITFFLDAKQKFNKYDTDNSNSINEKELPTLLGQFSFKFEKDTLQKLMSVMDTDASGELSFSEVIELVLYLEMLSRLFSQEDKDKSGILEPSELQALLRCLNVNVSVLELEIFLKKHPIKNLNFTNFVNLLFDIKANLATIREEAWKERSSHKKVEHRTKSVTLKLKNKKSLQVEIKKQGEYLASILAKLPVGKKWEDPDFPANPDLLFPTVKRGAQAIKMWKRVEDFPGGQLFVGGVNQGDVKQGALGDCWFLSSLCVLASQGEDAVKQLFVNFCPKEGIVQCRFHKDNRWNVVTVDDRIPCGANGLPVFASCRDPNELWVPLLEKAYAKLHGNFEAIESGSITDGLVDLTGEGSEVTDVGKTDDFFKILQYNINNGYLMGCAAQAQGAGVEEATPLGILMLHAYGILNAVEVEGNKLVCIRNPWGRYEWKGRWCDNAKEWTPSIIKKLNVEFEDDGVFWMDFGDFSKHFNKLYVLRALTNNGSHIWKRYDFEEEWNKETSGGCLNNPTWNKNPQFHLKSAKDTKVFISLKQPDLRVRMKKTPVYKAIGFAVLVKGDSADQKKTTVSRTDLVTMSAFFSGREISSEFTAKAGVDYVIIPSFFEKGVESGFYISIFTFEKQCIVNQIGKPTYNEDSYESEDEPHVSETTDPRPNEDFSLSINSQWVKGKTAGGCPVNASWKISPQFILTLTEPEKVSILVKQKSKNADGKYNHVGFFIFKAERSLKRKLVPTDIVFQTEFLNAEEMGSEVELQAGSYNIMVSTYHENLEGQFTLTVKSKNVRTHNQFYELTADNDWKSYSLAGAWEPGKDGGCSNNQTTYMNNPKFLLRILDNTNIKIVLDVPTNIKSAAGFYVFNTKDEKTPTALAGLSSFVQPSNLQHIVVIKDLELKVGAYIVMPATFTPNIHAKFDISVFSDKQKFAFSPL